nr:MAG: replication initiator protein [Microvirus sp.]
MTCYHPIPAFRTAAGVSFSELRRDDHIGSIEIPCGQCWGCRLRRAQDWELRITHEAAMWPRNCFVTLTYARDKLPPNGSLCHRDFQLFMKRLRKIGGVRVGKKVVYPVRRFYMCGEYGEENGRPHFHACLFNVDFDDRVLAGKSRSGHDFYGSELLSRLWPYGRAMVQDLVPETASYCARYVMKKVTGDAAELHYRRVVDGREVELIPEYNAMSLKPGVGARWFEKYSRDVFPHDFVIQRGAERQVPKYYDKLLKRAKYAKADEVEFARQKRASAAAPDNTSQRRAVREQVAIARARNQLRGDV